MIPPIIVVGTGRSGTSTVARILHERLGVAMAPRESLFALAGRANPQGCYEDMEVRQAHIDMLKGSVRLPDFRDRMLELACHRSHQRWGWKDPRGSHLLGLHLQWFPEATVIWCMRDVDQVAQSIHRWYGTPLPRALAETEDRWNQLASLLEYRPYRSWKINFDKEQGEAYLEWMLGVIVKSTPRQAPEGRRVLPAMLAPAGHAREPDSTRVSGTKS